MKKTTLLLALLFVTMANAQKWDKKKVAGNGNETTITRTTSDYDEISVGGPLKVDFVSG